LAKKSTQQASKKSRASGAAAGTKRPAKTASAARSKSAKERVSKKAAVKPKPAPRKAAAARPAPAAVARATKRAPSARADSRARPAARRVELAAPAETLVGRGTAKPLTPDDTEELRNMLIHKRAEILGDMSTLQTEVTRSNRQDAAGDLSTMPIHMADLGSDNYELEFTLGLIEGERAILKEIEEALERIRQGTYGFCLATGNPIGKARLKAKPWAKYCYEYTLAQEKGRTHGPA